MTELVQFKSSTEWASQHNNQTAKALDINSLIRKVFETTKLRDRRILVYDSVSA